MLYIAMSGFALGNLRQGFSVHMRRIGAVLVQKLLFKHKLKASHEYKNVMPSLAVQ